MGKRSNFERKEKDFYKTPYAAVLPLLPHIGEFAWFYEPCAGEGDLVRHLKQNFHSCGGSSDDEIDARTATYDMVHNDYFITNPPWSREVLHPIIQNLSRQAPTWLLLDADWMHTIQAAPYMKWCRKIISIGRVKWIEDSKHTGKDNCCWYLFDAAKDGPTEFIGR